MEESSASIEQRRASYLHLLELARGDPEAFSEFFKGRHQSGNTLALMEMVYWCVRLDWKLPEWAADAFILAVDKVRSAQSGSWDEVFGKPYPGEHIEKVRRHLKSTAIYIRVTKLHEQGNPIDNGMFERVGKEFSLAKTQCAELYYKFKKREEALQAAGFSHFPKNRQTSGNT
jgi:hypothetical protein